MSIKVTLDAKIIGKNLKKLRKIKQISQVDLARILGVTFQQVQKYERGVNRLPIDKLYRAKEHLNVPYDLFFNGVGGVNNRFFEKLNDQITNEIGQISDQSSLLNILSVINMFKEYDSNSIKKPEY